MSKKINWKISNWKVCLGCKEYKKRDEFHDKKSAKDGKQSYCKLCSIEKAKADYKDNNRKDVFAARASESRKKCLSFANDVKKFNGCCCCGENDPCCLDFHHMGEKLYEVSELVQVKNKIKMIEEMKKCAVVCASCHRKIHAGRDISKNLKICNVDIV